MVARIRFVILDFDGTCTQIDRVWHGFLEDYRKAIGAAEKDWKRACDAVAKASPHAGWTVMNAPSTAPAAADPYIQAFEAAALLVRERLIAPPPDVFRPTYHKHVAPFRPELGDVLEALLKKRIKVAFISNSDTTDIHTRIKDLFARNPTRGELVHVSGGAQKFLVKEPLLDAKLAAADRARFDKLDAALRVPELGRPIYLRRGGYFEALCDVYKNFGETAFPIEQTLVCGDIYDLDLAMPAALGAHVHLIERAAPYATYDYERARLAKGHVTPNLKGLLRRL